MWLSLEASADLSIFSVPGQLPLERISPVLRQGTSSSSTDCQTDNQSMRQTLSKCEGFLILGCYGLPPPWMYRMYCTAAGERLIT